MSTNSAPKIKSQNFTFSTTLGVKEGILYLETLPGLTLEESLDVLEEARIEEEKKLGWSLGNLAFSRFYLSDIINQQQRLYDSVIYKNAADGAVSTVEQRPISGGKIGWLLYYVGSPDTTTALRKCRAPLPHDHRQNICKVELNNYRLLFAGGLTGKSDRSSYEQTTGIFSEFDKILLENAMNLLGHTIRTWVYVRDVDNNYSGMVKSRGEFFERNGLTKSTRYIASTGIEAKLNSNTTFVSMDSLSIGGLKPSQIVRMEALEYLNPTHEYGVTFERGTKVVFGDRSHLHISGTASIDNKGQVLHRGDPGQQTVRTLKNIEELLKPHGATLSDMGYFIVYLRNPNDQLEVLQVLNEKIPRNRPMVFVQGPVCRPEWLVEIEGWAWIKNATPEFPPLS